MIDKNLVPVKGLKKEPFSGCHMGMRYMFITNEDSETFTATVYPEPWAFDKTTDENKQSSSFPLSDEGMDAAVAWLHEQYKEKEDFWREAEQNSMHVVHKR